MADLENLLLEAAGRTNTGRKSLRNSDHEHDGALMEASCQIPFKKRHEQTEVGEEKDDSDVGSDLYKDDDDRKILAEMTELEREIILSDRAAKRDEKRLREMMKQQLNEKRSVNPQPRRSLARNANRSNVLTQLRLKQRDSKSVWEKHSASAALTSSSDDDDDNVDDEAQVESVVEQRFAVSDPDPPFFDDVKGITIRRSKLGKWFTEPFFEELIIGCFVRIGIGMSESGPMYRLCQVSSINASDLGSEYEFEGKRTHKCLVCFWGSESSAAKWKMAMVSNSEPTEEEFRQWAREVERSRGRAPRRREVLEKTESIERAGNFVYSAETVKQMLEEKKRTLRPVNVAVEKERLRRKLEAAESRYDEAEAEQIKARLLELEEARRAEERDAKAVKLIEMNKRNRAENLKNAFSERLRYSRVGEAGYDPFSRRWTRSRNCYEGKSAVGRDGEAVAEKDKGMKPEADSDDDDDGRISAESGAAIWNVEILISLNKIDGFGPHGVKAGYLARKQRIEAMIGHRVTENVWRKGSQILAVSDYKKRRGML